LPSGLQCGDAVDLIDDTGHWLARGLVNPGSELRVRLYSWDRGEPLDDKFWRSRIDQALQRRVPLGLGGPQACCRLIFSEADRLSGIIVDRYGEYLVIQVTAAVWLRRLNDIVSYLQEVLRPAGCVVWFDEKTAALEGVDPRPVEVIGRSPPDALEVNDGGLTWIVDLLSAQKTGLYLDQRDNRLAAAAYLRDARVLDVCTYVGGFGLSAAAAGAREVIGVDSSARALAAAEVNAARNGLSGRCQWRQADCFEILETLGERRESFDAVVLDPPRFAGSRATVETALRAYQRLNCGALRLLRPGGHLVTCSCSGRVTRNDFLNMLVGASRRAGRDLIVLQQRGAAADHPTLLSCPESDYLKCLIAEVR
jgi:23S rRNA (cytosine1962-C5)-methyltransferase